MDNIYLLIWLVGFVTLILRGYWLASKHEKDTVAYYSDGYPVTKRECLIINNIMLGIYMAFSCFILLYL